MDITLLKTIKCDQGAIRAVRFNVDGTYCLTCGSDKKIKLWNPHRGIFLKSYGGHGNDVYDACGSSDSSKIVSCGADKTVILWDVSTGQPLRRFRGHAGRVSCVKFNDNDDVAVSGAQDNTVIFWDIRGKSNDPMQVLKDAKDGITSVQVLEHNVLSSSLDCSVRSYDIRSGKVVSDFMGETITCMTLTRDGQCLIVSTADDTIKLLDRATGELLAEFIGHQNKDYVIENCVNTKDNYVLSGSADGNVYCWELISQKVSRLLPHELGQVVHSIAPHPTKECYITASGANIYLWGENEDDGEA